MKLTIILPPNRAYQGYFVCTDDAGKILASGRCLGKADNMMALKNNNAHRNPQKPYGDTPTGKYRRTKAVMFAIEDDTYGKGWIPIEGKSGDALAALEGGRDGLGIHAGRDFTDGHLYPSYGCLRVSTKSFDDIVEAAAGGYIWITIEQEKG